MLRYAVPALAAAGSALAQSSCRSSRPTTIQNAGDAAAIAACTTYSGDIVVATGTTGDLAFNSPLEVIDGDITVRNAPNVTSLSGDSLTEITGTWTLNDVQTLNTLNFPQLTSVGSIDWEGLANLGSLAFTSSIQQTDSFNLQNTRLSDLTGIDLKKCSSFYLANNRNLQSFAMQLQNVTGSIVVQSNGARMNVTFPNLDWAQNITIDDVVAVDMPALMAVNGSIGFNENDELESIRLPNLTRVDQAFIIAGNKDLKSFSVPKLETVKGAINVANNSILSNISFPALTTVLGAFDAYGNFSSVSLPKISDIRGNFNVQSTKDIKDDCDTLQEQSGPNSAIQGGEFNCEYSKPEATGTSDGSSGNSNDGSGSSSGGDDDTGAAGPARVPAVEIAGVVGLVVAVLAMM